MHVFELLIISDEVSLFVSVFDFNQNAYSFFFKLLFQLISHRRGPAPLRFYMMWIRRRVCLQSCGAAVSRGFGCGLGSCSYAYRPFFPLYLPCNVYLPVSSVLLSSRTMI